MSRMELEGVDLTSLTVKMGPNLEMRKLYIHLDSRTNGQYLTELTFHPLLVK